MADYFGYDVTYVMNVTDVDDKIIRRARHQHLLRQYAGGGAELRRVVDDCTEALKVGRVYRGFCEKNVIFYYLLESA